MAKSGSAIKSVIGKELALELGRGNKIRIKRDASPVQKQYQASFKSINRVLERAIKEAENDPEYGIVVSRQCTRFVMKTMSDPKEDIKRAMMLKQYKTLETCLAEVRKPVEYLASMREQFGPDLDPRNYSKASDAFNNIVKSQKDRIYRDSQGFNGQEEKVFCTNRRVLLGVVEKGYNKLRDMALGIL
jgi:hypothetical protein